MPVETGRVNCSLTLQRPFEEKDYVANVTSPAWRGKSLYCQYPREDNARAPLSCTWNAFRTPCDPAPVTAISNLGLTYCCTFR